jgi:SAM-dependent methyltransferase
MVAQGLVPVRPPALGTPGSTSSRDARRGGWRRLRRRAAALASLVVVALAASSPVVAECPPDVRAAARPLTLRRSEEPPSDSALWDDFVAWAAALPRLDPPRSAVLGECYVERLLGAGLSQPEADEWLARVLDLRSASRERERIYWDARLRLGGGPSAPLPLLRDVTAGLSPGRALDVGMGLGRNAVYLATLGWRVTGYDFAPEAIAGTLRAAARAGVSVEALQDTHESFDLGAERWELIVVSYAYTDSLDPTWPPRLLRALAPGGRVVFQGAAPKGTTAGTIRRLWRGFRIERLELLERGEDWFAGRDQATIKLVAIKGKPPRQRAPRSSAPG